MDLGRGLGAMMGGAGLGFRAGEVWFLADDGDELDSKDLTISLACLPLPPIFFDEDRSSFFVKLGSFDDFSVSSLWNPLVGDFKQSALPVLLSFTPSREPIPNFSLSGDSSFKESQNRKIKITYKNA